MKLQNVAVTQKQNMHVDLKHLHYNYITVIEQIKQLYSEIFGPNWTDMSILAVITYWWKGRWTCFSGLRHLQLYFNFFPSKSTNFSLLPLNTALNQTCTRRIDVHLFFASKTRAMSLQQGVVCWTDEKTLKKKRKWKLGDQKQKHYSTRYPQSSRAPKPKVCLIASK